MSTATAERRSVKSERTKAERNILRWLVQTPLDAWPRISVLRPDDFQTYRQLFELLHVLVGGYIGDRVRPKITQEALEIAAPDFGIDTEDIGPLFERCHESVCFEALDVLRKEPLSLDELNRQGRLANVCQLIAEQQIGISQRSESRSFFGKPASQLWELADLPVRWLVDGVFSCDQPTIFGAKQKSLKTTLLTDLAVSLATGFPWLNRFEIPEKRRVLFVTGESSEAAAIRKVKRAAESRNLRRSDLSEALRIEAITFPTLPSREDQQAVSEAVKQQQIDVVLLDPLYMGLQGLNTANLTEVGPAMRGFMAACSPANVIIAHHVKKSASYDDAPNLEDLSQAGIAEFAGNYWLMGRMSEYTGDGMHELAIRYGGRDEQFGLLKLEFDERAWEARFTSLVDHREDLKARRETERVNAMTARIEKELGRNADGMSEYKLAVAVGTQKDRGPFQDALGELEQRGRIILIPEFKPERSKHTSKGWKLATERQLTK